MCTRVLEFKEKQEVITLDELKLSVTAKAAGVKRQIEHFNIFDDILEKCVKQNYNTLVSPIYVAGGVSAKKIPALEPHVGVNNIQAWYLDKITGTITFPSFNNELTTCKINIEHSDRGLSIAFGKVVLICSNGMTAFRSDIVTTYGEGKLNYNQCLELVEKWLYELPEKNEQYDNLITQMINRPIIKEAIPELIGKLELKAVEQAYCKGDEAPFNISQVSNFSKNIITSYKEEKPITNVWELYNAGTLIQKPNLMDISTINNTNFLLTDFFMKEYLN
jgi:hypothetical protein